MTMERFHSLALSDMTPQQREVAHKILSGSRDELTGPFPALLSNPPLADAVATLGEQLRFRSTIPPHLIEFAILISARHWSSHFEWHFHRTLALKAGLDSHVVDQLAQGRPPVAMGRQEAIVYRFCTELLCDGAASAEAIEAVIAEFADQGFADLIALVGYYCMISMILNTVRFPLPPGVEPLAPMAS